MLQETVTIMLSGGHGGPPEPVEIPRRVGRVKIGDLLGEGAGGAVFLGYDEALNRRVAVKVLHRRAGQLDDVAAGELAEGLHSAARIKHPNIVTVYNVETYNRTTIIVMEFIDGVSLRHLLLRSGALDLSLALYVMRSIVAGVEALHDAGVVHRDLKPANILFDRDGQAHVCDFGLACEFDALRREGSARNIGGSPLYMAPEMFDGQISPQSDVYALGVILFELLTGSPPFSADTLSEIKASHVAATIPMHLLEKRGVPEPIRDVVRRTLNKQRILRFKTATHLLRALESVEAPDPRGEAMRTRLATLVAAAGPTRGDRPPDAPTPSHALTTFDLLAERAKRKRETRE